MHLQPRPQLIPGEHWRCDDLHSDPTLSMGIVLYTPGLPHHELVSAFSMSPGKEMILGEVLYY